MNTFTTITTAIQPSAGVWDFVNGQMDQAKAALIAASIVGAIVIILGTAVKTKAIMPVLIAAVVGAALIFLASGGLETFSGKMGETVNAGARVEAPLSVVPFDLGE